MALAPNYVPLTATEASDAAVLCPYKPQPWSFEARVGNNIGPVHWPAANKDLGKDEKDYFELCSPLAEPGPSSRQLVQRLKLKKKRETLDDVANALSGDPDVNRFVAPALHLWKTHTSLQSRFRSLVQDHHCQCKERLGALILQAIGRKSQSKYPKLCKDVVKIASSYVQLQLNIQMHTLADCMTEYALIGQRSAVNISTGKHTVSKYNQWVDEEMQAYLLFQTSLVA